MFLALLLGLSSVAMRPLPQAKHFDVAIVPRPKVGGRVHSATSRLVSATSLAAVSLFAMAPPAAAAVKVAKHATFKMPWILPSEPLSAILTVVITTFTALFSAFSWVLSVKFQSFEDKIESSQEVTVIKFKSLEDFVKVQAQETKASLRLLEDFVKVQALETKASLRLAAQATMNPARAHIMYADQRSTDEIIMDPANAPLAFKSNLPDTTQI